VRNNSRQISLVQSDDDRKQTAGCRCYCGDQFDANGAACSSGARSQSAVEYYRKRSQATPCPPRQQSTVWRRPSVDSQYTTRYCRHRHHHHRETDQLKRCDWGHWFGSAQSRQRTLIEKRTAQPGRQPRQHHLPTSPSSRLRQLANTMFLRDRRTRQRRGWARGSGSVLHGLNAEAGEAPVGCRPCHTYIRLWNGTGCAGHGSFSNSFISVLATI